MKTLIDFKKTQKKGFDTKNHIEMTKTPRYRKITLKKIKNKKTLEKKLYRTTF